MRSARLPAALAATALLLTAAPAAAGPVLAFNYTGQVSRVDDPYGVFAGVSPGDPVAGAVRLLAADPPGGFGGGFFSFPTGLGGNALTAAVGPYRSAAGGDIWVDVADFRSTAGYTQLIIQGSDPGTVTGAPAGGLPPGTRVVDVYPALILASSDPSWATFPNLPSTVPPFSSFDPDNNIGLIFVTVEVDGRVAGSAEILFRFTSLTAVPEPASVGLLAAGGLGLLAARRRTAR